MNAAVIIPVYNHAARIEEVVRQTLRLGLPVIVVDDGSTDGSSGIMDKIEGIAVIRHPGNRGKGAAILSGFAAALKQGCDWAVTIDGDGQHKPGDARALLRAVPEGRRPIIVGRREGMTASNVPWTSRFGRGFSNFWVWVAGGPRIRDSQSGFRLYPLPESLQLGVKARRYQFEVEVLVRARQKGLDILETPVQVVYQARGERVSHFRPWLDFWRNSATFSRLIFMRIFGPFRDEAGYRLLVRMAGIFGPWVLAAASRIIAAGYFLFSGKVAESRRFYAALFPEQGRLRHLWCAFRQYQNFTTIHLDRFLAGRSGTTAFTSEGFEKLEAVIGRQGGILLMSHLGNWEMAARLLRQRKKDLKLLLYMGVKEKEGVEHMQKEELRRAGVTIIAVDRGDSSPFAAVEGIRFLREGGIVSMTGDRLWRSDQRRVCVSFLGHDAYLPAAPYIFALVSGAPLFVFFAFRTGKNRYRFTLSDPIAIRPESRQKRDAAIAGAAQQYADLLEKTLRQHPLEWYHFDRFIQAEPASPLTDRTG